jgi:hypothetical protein
MATKKTKKATTKAALPSKNGKGMSALDAAAKVLAESKTPLNCRQIVEQMAAKGLWTSPGGATPWATISAAIGTEINKKGKDSRFTKASPGNFTIN